MNCAFPEDVVGDVGVVGAEGRHDDAALLAVVVELEEARHVVRHCFGESDSVGQKFCPELYWFLTASLKAKYPETLLSISLRASKFGLRKFCLGNGLSLVLKKSARLKVKVLAACTG